MTPEVSENIQILTTRLIIGEVGGKGAGSTAQMDG